MVPHSHVLSQSRFDSGARQTAAVPQAEPWLADEIRADIAFLASDELRGRGSATRDEHLAALFVASEFQKLGLQPGGDAGGYIQKINLAPEVAGRIRQRTAGFEDAPRTETWNAVAVLQGSNLASGALLLTAHLDHLGVGPADRTGDRIYNGADDDASGVSAVLALARALSQGSALRRTIVFAVFGSEEIGGFGNAGFLLHPPVPIGSIVANLEFEMVGRPDPAIGEFGLWLTGYDRSNLGSELVRHGAPLKADPHPAERFFLRSDNIAFARTGIIAHTLSSYGLHNDYHRPSDELSRIDFHHMIHVVRSMIDPIRWLANTDWRPSWNPGGQP